MNTDYLSHPPTPQELAEIYYRSQEEDPRSPSYKRILVRPKVPVASLTLFALLIIGAGVGAYVGVMYTWRCVWAAVGTAVVASVLIGLLLGKPLLIALVKTYQALAPERVRRRCRYEPSCSVYMIMALEKYGFWRGFRKGIKRWNSCKPPNGGYDLP